MTTQNNWVFNSQIKEAVGIEEDYTGEDLRISMINAATTQTLESLMGKCMSKNTYTEYLDSKANSRGMYDIYGDGSSGKGTTYKQVKYKLKNSPVDTNEVFELSYLPNQELDGSEILVEGDYVLDPESGTFIILKGVGSYPRALRVVYTAGYEAMSEAEEVALSYNLPADLQQAALWQAAHMYEKTKFSNINVRESRSQGSTNTTRYVNIHAIAPEAMAVIMRYKTRFVKFV